MPQCAYLFPPPFVDEHDGVLRCIQPAEYRIESTVDPHDKTHACADHVGQLLGDRAYLVTAIRPADPNQLGVYDAPLKLNGPGGTPRA